METQWDPEKAESNLGKHGIDFADAVGVFEDEWALTIREEQVGGEQRFATLGTDFLERVLVVVIRIEVGRSVWYQPGRGG